MKDVLATSGQPLDTPTRSFMEERFGRTFANVRVHTDQQAQESAEAINANAYTFGDHVVLNAVSPSTGTARGLRLLAHELAHVVQQQRGGNIPPTFQPDHAVEQHADHVAAQVVDAGRASPVPVGGASGLGVVRQFKTETAGQVQDVVVSVPQPGEAPWQQPMERYDTAFVLDTSETMFRMEANAVAAQVLETVNHNEFARKVPHVDFPMRTMYILSHGHAEGTVGFNSGPIKLKDLAYLVETEIEKAKDDPSFTYVPPLSVVFRGCRLGQSPDALDAFRLAIGAREALGSNCFTVFSDTGGTGYTPIVINSKDIQTYEDYFGLSEAEQAQFDRAFKDRFDLASTSAHAWPRRRCAVGAAGVSSAVRLDWLRNAFFRNNGEMVAVWTTDRREKTEFSAQSICFEDLTEDQKKACWIKKVNPPEPGGLSGPAGGV